MPMLHQTDTRPSFQTRHLYGLANRQDMDLQKLDQTDCSRHKLTKANNLTYNDIPPTADGTVKVRCSLDKSLVTVGGGHQHHGHGRWAEEKARDDGGKIEALIG
ncbi:hypothetical protein F66182_9379 [Fusarium sp. NRRL 66182]|nr:hypothetical protein F66182_9379 [Fusarium sp. NRRL 66182]